jgi:uroporphyrin-III C-methyltransferase
MEFGLRAKVYLVGAGPGDPDLLTLKALRILQQADVVIYDRLISQEVLSLANPSAQLIYAGKRKGEQDEVQSEIYRAFLHHATNAQQAPGVCTIVRLKSGDPTVFGRCGEELAFLQQNGIAAEVVPGISSALAAPALNGIPLTFRNVATSFTVIAGHRESIQSIDWAAYSRVDTLIILMGVDNRVAIAESLLQAGRPPQEAVAFIENASTALERVIETTLSDVRSGSVDVNSPAVIVIGNVVRCRIIAKSVQAIAC